MLNADIFVPNIGLSNWPAVAVYKDKIYLVHEGMKHDGNLWWTYSSDGGSTWKTDYKIDNVATSGPPAMVVFKDKLYCFHRAQKNKWQLQYTVSNDGEIWSGDSKPVEGIGLSESPAVAVAVAVYKDKIYLVHQGMDHRTLWWSTFDGSTWTDDQPIDNVATSGSPALVAFKERLYCFHRGAGAQAAGLYYTVFNGVEWSDDTFVKDIGLSNPPAVAVYDNLIYLLHQGMDDDHGLWLATFDGNTWSEDRRIDGVGISGPPALVVFKEKLYAFHQGMKDSGQLWYTVFTSLKWNEERGENSYCHYSVWSALTSVPKEGMVANKAIMVNRGAPFLIANISRHREFKDFPTGAMLTIKGPDGTIYNQETTGGKNLVINSESSLQSLLIKEPQQGYYQITLTANGHVPFLFTFETLPSKDIVETIEKSHGSLQKRAGSGAGAEQVTYPLALIWVNVNRRQQNLTLLEEPVGYLTGSRVSVLHTPTPTTVPAATQTIIRNIQWPPDFNAFITPPAPPIRVDRDQPVIEFVQNGNGALLWLHAQITRNHLNTGTNTNQAMRDFARRLGLPTDDAGHVIGNRLGGLGTVEWNIFPQNPNFNRGAYNRYVEGLFADTVTRYGSIEVWFRFHYDNRLLPDRPNRFDFIYRLPNGSYYYNDLLNPERVPRGA